MFSNDVCDEFLRSGTLISTARGTILVGWGSRIWSQEPQESDAPSFYFPDFFLRDSRPWFSHGFWVELTYDKFLQHLSNVKCQSSPALQWNNHHRSVFETTFHTLQGRFASKQLQKAVPYVFEVAEETIELPRLSHSIISLLGYASKNPVHIYGFWENGQGILAQPLNFYSICEEQGMSFWRHSHVLERRGDLSLIKPF